MTYAMRKLLPDWLRKKAGVRPKYKGLKVWVNYRYTDDGSSTMEVEIAERYKDGYFSVAIPSMFGGDTFKCLVHPESLFETESAALEAAKKIKPSKSNK